MSQNNEKNINDEPWEQAETYGTHSIGCDDGITIHNGSSGGRDIHLALDSLG